MALLTLGTAANNTLSAVKWNSAMSVSDLAALNALAAHQNDFGVITRRPIPMVNQGGLYDTSRGHLKLFEGDYIGVDPNTGEFIVINAATAAAASWVHT